jgi:hypothetical protein
LAHCSDTSFLLSEGIRDSKQLKHSEFVEMFVSACTIPDNSVHNIHENNNSTSVQVDEYQHMYSMYAIAEITYGGLKTVKKKLIQLEKDCTICKVKAGNENVLQVVAIAIVVNPYPHFNALFEALSLVDNDYPNLTSLYNSGRFLFIQYTYTLTIALNIMNENMLAMNENMFALKENMLLLNKNVKNILKLLGRKKKRKKKYATIQQLRKNFKKKKIEKELKNKEVAET